jgi:hypothetical protein
MTLSYTNSFGSDAASTLYSATEWRLSRFPEGEKAPCAVAMVDQFQYELSRAAPLLHCSGSLKQNQAKLIHLCCCGKGLRQHKVLR